MCCKEDNQRDSEKRRVVVGDTDTHRRTSLMRRLSRMNYISCPAQSLEVFQTEISRRRHDALLITENLTSIRALGTLCTKIRNDDPGVVLVVRLNQKRRNLEARLLDEGIDDVVTLDAPANVVAKRIILRLNMRSVSRGSKGIVYLKNTVVDLQNLKVWNRGKIRKISKGLASFLTFFLNNRDRVISRQEILESLWSDVILDPEGKNIDMHVSKLRRLIEPDPQHPILLRSIRGVGYEMSL